MRQRPRHRRSHLHRAGTGVLALIAFAAVVQAWNHFSAGAVPRSNLARRVADLADAAPAEARLALAEADPAALEFADVRVVEADEAPQTRPSPPAAQTSSEPISIDIERPPDLSMARAGPELAISPVDPGEADIGSAIDDPRPEGDGLPERLVGVSEVDPRGPLAGTGGALGPFIGIGGGIGLGGGIGIGGSSGTGPFTILGGGRGCERRTCVRLPGPLGGNPTLGAPTIPIPTTVPVDPSDFVTSGGRRFVPEAPDLGRTDGNDLGSTGLLGTSGTPIGSAPSGGGSPASGSAIARLIEETARSFGTRSTQGSFRQPEARQLQGPRVNANPSPPTMRERVQRALVRPTEAREARPTATRQLPSVGTAPTRSTSRVMQAASRATQARSGAASRPVQARRSAPSMPTRTATPAVRTRASTAAAAAVRRATQTRSAAAARPTRALPKRREQQQR